MKIQVGSIVMNRTKKYLSPCLKAYGKEFEKRFNFVFKVAIGIGDIILVKTTGSVYEQHLFILLDTTNGNSKYPAVGRRHFNEFLSWIREQDMYEEDYAYDSISEGNLHMIVVKLHPDSYKSLQHFKKSQFSKMYTLKEIEDYFDGSTEKRQEKAVLIKDHEYKIQWADRINQEFDTTLSPDEIEGELDYPMRKDEEYFGGELGRS